MTERASNRVVINGHLLIEANWSIRSPTWDNGAINACESCVRQRQV